MATSEAEPASEGRGDARQHAPHSATDAPHVPLDLTPDTQPSLPAKRPPELSDAPSKKSRPSVSLSMWLASSGQSADPEQLPPPITCPDARIEDRNSVFVGYVYPLTTASPTRIGALLDNLTRVVHPAIPASQLPPQFQHSAPNRRGSTHDMYAYRVLQLKPGRNGLQGPNDFGMEQGLEDDGEHWGAEKIMRVIREMGASDVLVIVSRWYGGELLGPVRFDHITNAARAALRQFLHDEAIQERRNQLQVLDRKIALARQPNLEPPVPDPYHNLTMDRAQRLLRARTKTLQMVQRRTSPASDNKPS